VHVVYVSIRTTENYEFDKIRAVGVTGNSTNYKNSQGEFHMFSHTGSSPAGGGQWCPAPPFEIGAPHFRFSPLVAAYIQYCILKMWPPFCFFSPSSGFWHQLLLNLGDGPATRDEISQPSQPISPRATTELNHCKYIPFFLSQF